MSTSRPAALAFLALVTVLSVGRSVPAASASAPAATYIALGDSLGYGVTTQGITPDPECKSKAAAGYVCIVYGYLHQINHNTQLLNLSAPDVDSCVMAHGTGAACPTSPAKGSIPSPLDAAVAYVRAHPGDVGPVTVNVGGADLIPLLPAALSDPVGTAAKLPGVLVNLEHNLDVILGELRSALGPDGQVIVVTQYNPLGGIGSPPLPAGLPDIAQGAIRSMNDVIKRQAVAHGAAVADVASTFDASPDGAAVLTFVPTSLASGDPAQINIYPLAEGYRLYAQTVLKAGGWSAPLSVKARLSKASARHGKTIGVRGSTISGGVASVKIALPHHKKGTKSLIANNDGSYKLTGLAVGKVPGKGSVRVCVSDPITARKICSGSLPFKIR